MIKSEIVVLTEKEKPDIPDADVTVRWKLQPAAEIVVGERKKES
jgi:hypothetical protein